MVTNVCKGHSGNLNLFMKCLVDSDVPEHCNSWLKKNLNNGGLRVWIMYMSTHIIAICELFCQVSMG